MIRGNKGEWSEIYTFFKLLSEAKLYSWDENYNKNEDIYYPIVKILREEKKRSFEYKIEKNLIFVFGGEEDIVIPMTDFHENAEKLIKKIRKESGTFSFPEVEEFMNSIYCYTLKAKSTDKTDIKIVIHDLRTGAQPVLGFSIKSDIGANSTLFNPSIDNTNFIYKIKGIDNIIAEKANKIKKFNDKFKLLNSYGATYEFVDLAGKILKNNLLYIDCCLPEILDKIIFKYFSTLDSKIADIIEKITEENPLNFDASYNQDFYVHKIKRFLCDITLGMKPAKPWKGIYEANGGYLIVKEDGDIICYHIYHRNQFENYLFNNTRLESPSTKKHKYGNIYEENREFFIKLNLQIRFI